MSNNSNDTKHRQFSTTRPTDAQIIATITVRSMEREWRDLKARYGHLPEFADMIRRDTKGEAS